jgi:hypothetical protein
MKKIFLVLALMIPVLSGCFVVLDDIPTNMNVDIVGVPTITTNYLLRNNLTGATVAIICDEFTNNTLIKFRYTGGLRVWEAFMSNPQDSVDKTNRRTYTFGSNGVSHNTSTGDVTFTYSISPTISPLSNTSIMPSIVVNPIDEEPQVLGETRVYFSVPGYEAFNEDIPVIGNCAALSSGNLVAIQSSKSSVMQK